MTSKKTASIKPSAFADADISESIEELVASGKKPPKLSSAEIKQMDMHTTGIYSVYEALQRRPIAKFNYWGLSRCASLVALNRLSHNDCVLALVKERQLYQDAISNKGERVRKHYNDFLLKMSSAYSPFLEKEYLHIQFWDEEVYNGVLSLLGEAGIPQTLFYVFIADALSEIVALNKICDSLKEESKFGLLFLNRLLVTYQTVNSELLG